MLDTRQIQFVESASSEPGRRTVAGVGTALAVTRSVNRVFDPRRTVPDRRLAQPLSRGRTSRAGPSEDVQP